MYGPKRSRYFDGIKENVWAVGRIYPKGYTVRVHHDKSWEEDQQQACADTSGPLV
jgi:hypothetical protein